MMFLASVALIVFGELAIAVAIDRHLRRKAWQQEPWLPYERRQWR